MEGKVLIAPVVLVLSLAACGGGEREQTARPGTHAGALVGAPGEISVAERGDVAEDLKLVTRTGAAAAVGQLGGPRVIQTASLRISVVRGRFEQAAERVRMVADGLGGFVVSSSASQGGGERRLVNGTLVLRVPVKWYAQAMSRLARIGRVEGREEAGQDLSREFVDLEARARHLEAVEERLLGLLSRAESVESVLAIQTRLDGVQLELEQLRGQLRYLADQTELATVSVSIAERWLAAAPGASGDSGILAAWRDGVEGFVRVVGRIFVALATAAPVLLLAGVALLGGRALLRRRPLRASPPRSDHVLKRETEVSR